MQNRVTKTSVRSSAVGKQPKQKKSNSPAENHLPALDLFWASFFVRVQVTSLLLISPGLCQKSLWSLYIYIYRSMLWWWQCSVRYSLPLSSTSWDLGPRQYHFRDNSALNPFNQPTELSFIHGRHYCVMRQPGSDRQSSAAVAEQSVQQLSSIIQHNNYLPGCITDDTQPALVARGNAPMNGSTWLRARSRDQNTTITS